MPVHILTDADHKEAVQVGRARLAQDRAAGLQNQRVTQALSEEALHVLGVKGEWAATQWLGLPLAAVQELTPGGRRRGDIQIPGTNTWIECKTVTRPYYDLLALPAKSGKTLSAAVYCLIRPVDDTPALEQTAFELLGWIQQVDFLARGTFRTLFRGLQWSVRANQLDDLHDLPPWIQAQQVAESVT
tara:strand:+ start:88 stop:648 length:561 start_codon:yes stop_codon:yes gene_type:complete